MKKKKYIHPFIKIDDLGEDLLTGLVIGSGQDNDSRQSKTSSSNLIDFSFDDSDDDSNDDNGLYSY